MLQSVEILDDFTYFGRRENVVRPKWRHDRLRMAITWIPNLFKKIISRGKSTFHINKWRSYICKCNGMLVGWGVMACQTVTVIEAVREFSACSDGLAFCFHVINVENCADRKAHGYQNSN